MEIIIEKHAVAVLTRFVLKRQRNQVSESACRHRILARKEPVIRIEADIRTAIHRRRDKQRAEAPRFRSRDWLGKENPSVSAIARARSFNGDGDVFCPGGVTKRSDIRHPALLVEIGGEEPTCLIAQHGIDADREIHRIARCFACEMRTENIIANSNERLVWAFTTLDLWLAAHASDPLVTARGRIACFSGYAVLPSARKHIVSPSEQAPEERDLFCRGRRRSRTAGGEKGLLGRLLRRHPLQHVQLLGNFRTLPVERDQPTLQGFNLPNDVVFPGDRIAPFRLGCGRRRPVRQFVCEQPVHSTRMRLCANIRIRRVRMRCRRARPVGAVARRRIIVAIIRAACRAESALRPDAFTTKSVLRRRVFLGKPLTRR
jgi:hypothetical protein